MYDNQIAGLLYRCIDVYEDVLLYTCIRSWHSVLSWHMASLVHGPWPLMTWLGASVENKPRPYRNTAWTPWCVWVRGLGPPSPHSATAHCLPHTVPDKSLGPTAPQHHRISPPPARPAPSHHDPREWKTATGASVLVAPAPPSSNALVARMLPCVTAIVKAVAPWYVYQFKERLACGGRFFLASGPWPLDGTAKGPWPSPKKGPWPSPQKG